MRQNRRPRTTRDVETSDNASPTALLETVDIRELPTFPQILYPSESAKAHLDLTNAMDESIIDLTRRVHDYVLSGQSRTEAEIRKRFGLAQEEFDTVVVWLLANGDIDLDNRFGQINLKPRWQRFAN